MKARNSDHKSSQEAGFIDFAIVVSINALIIYALWGVSKWIWVPVTAALTVAIPELSIFVNSLRTLRKEVSRTSEMSIPPPHETYHFEVGSIGMSTSRLSPYGNVIIEGKQIEAKSNGNLIQPNTKIRVVNTSHHTLVVEEYEEGQHVPPDGRGEAPRH